MWWRIGALALLTAGFVALLAAPTSTVEITVEMPRVNGASGAIDADAFALVATLISYATVAAILALMGWLAWQIVRDVRKLKDRR